jgi:hypothetical protein
MDEDKRNEQTRKETSLLYVIFSCTQTNENKRTRARAHNKGLDLHA